MKRIFVLVFALASAALANDRADAEASRYNAELGRSSLAFDAENDRGLITADRTDRSGVSGARFAPEILYIFVPSETAAVSSEAEALETEFPGVYARQWEIKPFSPLGFLLRDLAGGTATPRAFCEQFSQYLKQSTKR